MKKTASMMLIAVLLVASFAGAGCGRKPQAAGAQAQARQLLVAGTDYLKQGDVVKAVQSFATAIKLSPDNFEGYFVLAETFLRLKQFDQARAVLQTAAERFPDNPAAFYLLAIACQGSGDVVPAIMAARRSIELFQLRQDAEGAQRSAVFLAALVQMAKQQAEAGTVQGDAAQSPSIPKAAQ